MSFMVFQLLFALVALALVAVLVIVVRQLARKRQSSGDASSEPPAPRMPGLGRKAAQPEPEADGAAPMRRRQLQSFAAAERSAAEADAVVLPMLEPETEAAPEIEPVPDVAPIAEPEAAFAAEPETEHGTEEALDYAEAVLGRLEEAFEDLQDDEITLNAYRERMQAERAAVEVRIAALQPAGASAELDAALAARDSVLWCLDWAEKQAGADRP